MRHLTPDNARRAERAQGALDVHAEACNLDTETETTADRVAHLLADLRHLAHRETLDWTELVAIAEQRFQEELRPPRTRAPAPEETSQLSLGH